MNRVSAIVTVVTLLFYSNTAFADCDFSKVVHNQDGTVTYSLELHHCVGQLVQDNATKDQQIADYTKAITLKDLAITKSDQRAQLWEDTAFKVEDRIQKIDSYKSTSNWIYFSLGALTVFGAGVMAAQLSHR